MDFIRIIIQEKGGEYKMFKYKVFFITLLILLSTLTTVNADIILGDFNYEAATSNWGASYVNSQAPTGAEITSLTTLNYSGTSCLMFIATCTSALSIVGSTTTTPWFGIDGGNWSNWPWQFGFTGETAIQIRVAFTGSLSTVPFLASSQSNPWSWVSFTGGFDSTNCIKQAADGNFVTYTFPLDTTTFANPNYMFTGLYFTLQPNIAGTVTTYIEYIKTLGDQPVNGITDFNTLGNASGFTNGWVTNCPVRTILGCDGYGQDTKGLTTVAVAGTNGCLEYFSLSTASSRINYDGGYIVTSYTNDGWDANWDTSGNQFIVVRMAATTTAVWDGTLALNASLNVSCYEISSSLSLLPGIPVDGQFHTYSYAFAQVTSKGFDPSNINQVGLDLSAHGNSNIKVDIDSILVTSTGSPLLYTNSGLVPVYNLPLNMIPIKPSGTKGFSVQYGQSPFTWSLTTSTGQFGDLVVSNGTTVTFTGANAGGTGYITVTDALGRSIRTPQIVVTATSAPLAVDADVTDMSHVQFDLFKE